jgi:hypothetical protein
VVEPLLGHTFSRCANFRSTRRARRGRLPVALACGFLASWIAGRVSADVVDADALIAALARTPPSSVAFAEARFSSLLLEPFVVSGELGYPAPLSLERVVSAPYRERTSLRGDSVTVTREGERPRTFALRRAPELRGLLTGLVGLLAGDAAAVRRSFDVVASGSADAWRLELTPNDANVTRRLTRLVATGAGAELRCFAFQNAQDGTTVMLIGAAADDGIAPDATLASLLDRCRAE